MVMTSRRPRVFAGWLVVFAAAMSTFAEVAFFNPVLGVFIPEFEREFGWSRTEISLAVTFGTLLAAAIAPFFGPLIDRYGGKPFVVGGGMIMTAGLVALANMETEWQFFIVYAIGRATATGLISVAATVTVSKWFVRRRGLAVGITTIGTRTAFATMPIGLQLIIDAADWRTAAYTLAAVVAVVGTLPAFLWLTRRPEDAGLQPDGETGTGSETSRQPRHREVSWTRKQAMATRAFWMITLAISLQTFASGAVNLHQIPYMVDQGISQSQAALVLSLYAVFAGFGGLIQSAIEARWGLSSRLIFAMGLLGSAFGMVLLILTQSFTMGVVFAAFYGSAFGLLTTSQQVVFAEYFGREALGAIRGASLPFYMLLQAGGPIFAGAFYDATGSYAFAFCVFGVGYVLAAVALGIAKRPQLPAGAETSPLAAA